METHKLTLMDHLTEFRLRLIRSLYSILVGLIICYNFSEQIFEAIRKPIEQYLPSGGLVFTGVADKFMAHVKISIYGGVVLACPFWFYQVWKFISPALYSKEKKYAVGFITSAVSLFLFGALFCYYIILPAAFEFLLGFGGTIDKPMITIEEYLSFVVLMCLMFGLSFELPLVLVVMGMLGLVSQKFLKEKRRFSAVFLALFSAIATPTPDAFSMFAMLIPLLFLYEVAVILVGFFERKRQAELAG